MYTLQQQVFALSFFSNAASKRHGTVDELTRQTRSAIDGYLTNAVTLAEIGAWRMVWGPVLFQERASS